MINITNMKYIRFLGVLLSLVVNTAVLHAQGFAGPCRFNYEVQHHDAKIAKIFV